MGTIHHDFAVAVDIFPDGQAAAAFAEVKAFAFALGEDATPFTTSYERLLVGPVAGVANHTETYFMVPDGSKEGWSTSDDGNDIRDFFIEKMVAAGCQVAHGAFGELDSSFSVK